ncbi:MAG: glycosyltransferase family 4 protein [Pseudorhodobacter sp.]
MQQVPCDESTQAGQTLRVAYLINQYPKVSHTFIRREILALERQGVHVERFALRGWDAETVDPADVEEKRRTRHVLEHGVRPLAGALFRSLIRRPGVTWRALCEALAMSRHSVRSWPYHLIWLAHACRLSEWMEGCGLTHIHAHFGTNSADIVYLLRLLGGPEYSFTIHGADEADNAKNLNFDRKVRGAKFVVAISSFTRSQLLRHVGPADWNKVKVVHCGLERGFFATQETPLLPRPVLLCIGRLSTEKGHLILLEAFARLAARHPDAQLVLAGDGDLRALVEARIVELGLGGKVTITGWVSSQQVLDLIVDSTILVQPSLMEGLPVVIMEAMAQRRPVISTFIAGIPELVLPGQTGWLVPAGEIESLSEAMEQAVGLSPEDLRAMGARAVARVGERHDIDKIAAQLARLFAK